MTTLQEKIQNIQKQLKEITNAINDLQPETDCKSVVERSLEEVEKAKSWDELRSNYIGNKNDLVELVLYNANHIVNKEMFDDDEFRDEKDIYWESRKNFFNTMDKIKENNEFQKRMSLQTIILP